MKKLETLNFEKLVNLIHALGLQLPEQIECYLDNEKVEGYVIASVGAHQYVVRNDNWDLFVNTVNTESLEDFQGLIENINIAIEYRVIMEDGRDSKVIKPFGVAASMDIDPEAHALLMERATGLMSICAGKIMRIAKLINIALDRVQNDGNVIKDFDALMTFNTELGHGFDPVLCMDKIPYMFGDMTTFEIQRSPMLEEDKKLYLEDEYERIDTELKDLGVVVRSFLSSKLAKSSIPLEELAVNIVNSVLVMQLMDQHTRFISFGGRDNWRMSGDTTPNSQRCHDLLDTAVEEIFGFLDQIEKPEGVDYWGIDVKTLAIFGRDKENRTIGEPLEESAVLTTMYNEGFQEMLKLRLRLIDNKVCVSV